MKKFMREAFLEAQRGIGAGDGGPFGAVISSKRKRLSRMDIMKSSRPTTPRHMPK